MVVVVVFARVEAVALEYYQYHCYYWYLSFVVEFEFENQFELFDLNSKKRSIRYNH